MMTFRLADERGHVRRDWLDTFHTFSFGDYFDPRHSGISNLRVINDDRIAPGGGFATHGHQDMEIVTWVLAGALQHRDSLGNGSVIRPGDVQHMSAGTGVRHSESNASTAEPVHLLQIWLLPNRLGVAPGYHQQHVPAAARRGRLALLVSPDGRDGSIPAHQDALLYAGLLADGETLTHPLATGRQAYVHLARGHVTVNDQALAGGDGLHITGENQLRIGGTGADAAEVLLFDLP
jgi:quercetin 2,3-dioxygenase